MSGSAVELTVATEIFRPRRPDTVTIGVSASGELLPAEGLHVALLLELSFVGRDVRVA